MRDTPVTLKNCKTCLAEDTVFTVVLKCSCQTLDTLWTDAGTGPALVKWTVVDQPHSSDRFGTARLGFAQIETDRYSELRQQPSSTHCPPRLPSVCRT
jgi:hypothetical protein